MGEYVNSKQLQANKSYVSCGILEIHHFPKQQPSQTLFALATLLYHKANPRPAAFVFFSDVVPDDKTLSRGMAFVSVIKNKADLVGKLIESSRIVNPRTGNVIQAWLLELDHENFRKWYQEELANRVED